MNNSLRKLVQKSNLQAKSNFEVIETSNIINGGLHLRDQGCDIVGGCDNACGGRDSACDMPFFKQKLKK
jgi:hypothetical protein